MFFISFIVWQTLRWAIPKDEPSQLGFIKSGKFQPLIYSSFNGRIELTIHDLGMFMDALINACLQKCLLFIKTDANTPEPL